MHRSFVWDWKLVAASRHYGNKHSGRETTAFEIEKRQIHGIFMRAEDRIPMIREKYEVPTKPRMLQIEHVTKGGPPAGQTTLQSYWWVLRITAHCPEHCTPFWKARAEYTHRRGCGGACVGAGLLMLHFWTPAGWLGLFSGSLIHIHQSKASCSFFFRVIRSLNCVRIFCSRFVRSAWLKFARALFSSAL